MKERLRQFASDTRAETYHTTASKAIQRYERVLAFFKRYHMHFVPMQEAGLCLAPDKLVAATDQKGPVGVRNGELWS